MGNSTKDITFKQYLNNSKGQREYSGDEIRSVATTYLESWPSYTHE